MSNLDRKNLLWEGSRMFLPEHRQALVQQRREAEHFIPPELDEQQLEAISYFIQEAIELEQPILVTYATRYQAECFCGFVDEVNSYHKYLQLSNGRQMQKISFHLLIDVTWP
jgi:hypothetical protein